MSLDDLVNDAARMEFAKLLKECEATSHAFKNYYECEPLDHSNDPILFRMRSLERLVQKLQTEVEQLKLDLFQAREEANKMQEIAKGLVIENSALRDRIESVNEFDRFDIMEM